MKNNSEQVDNKAVTKAEAARMAFVVKYVKKALRMALERPESISHEERWPIHHSDRGVQHASAEYVKLLNRHHLKISMTVTGNPKDNSQAERINS